MGNSNNKINPTKKIDLNNTVDKLSFAITNPYLHGTRSSILNILPHTEFLIMDDISMIKHYGLAPMSGELTRGRL